MGSSFFMPQSATERQSNPGSERSHPRMGLDIRVNTFRNGPQIHGVQVSVGENPSRFPFVLEEIVRMSGDKTLDSEVIRVVNDYLYRGDLSTVPQDFLEAVQAFRRQEEQDLPDDNRDFVLKPVLDSSKKLLPEGTYHFVLVSNPNRRRIVSLLGKKIALA